VRAAPRAQPPLPATAAAGKRALLARLLAERAAEPEVFPLSFGQQRLWFLYQLDPASAAYNMGGGLRLYGRLDVAAWRASLEEIVRRHEALRTTFASRDGEPVQVIARRAAVAVPVVDLAALPAAARDHEARRWSARLAAAPFDLARGPLLRTLLLRLAGAEHAMTFALHHIVCDGWSLGVLVRELAALYTALAAGRASPLSALPLQYADFALWQRAWLAGGELERQLAYWKRQLAGAPPALALPFDRPRPRVPSGRGAERPVAFSAGLGEALLALGRCRGATPFIVLLALFDALLARYSGEERIAVGTPIANRNQLQLEGMIGFFANTLVLAVDLAADPGFEDLLARAREVTLGAYDHQDLPFERLVEELQPDRDRGRSPLFQVFFVLQDGAAAAAVELPGLRLVPAGTPAQATQFDLCLDLTVGARGIRGPLLYDTDLFDAPTAARLAEHLRALAVAVVSEPRRRLSTLPLLSPGERQQLAVEWADAAPALVDALVHEWIAAQAARTPAAAAVEDGGRTVTYGELQSLATRLGHRLRALGIGAEAPVAVCLERSPELIVALLAILAAGGAYLPLDPAYPAERLALLLADSGARVLLTTTSLAAALPPHAAAVVCLDADLTDLAGREHRPATPLPGRPDRDSLAYVLYTSGTTGVPKGVAVAHREAAAHFAAFARLSRLGPGDRVLQFASPAFDVSLDEVLPTLGAGATVVLRAPDLWAPAEFSARAAALRLTVVHLPTAYWQQWLHEAAAVPPPDLRLRLVVAGTEAMPAAAAERWCASPLGSIRLLNGYGPTEATVTATAFAVAGACRAATVPIGRPLPGRSAHVLGRDLAPAPLGVAGQLYLGGTGLARGYLGRPDLTAARFVPHPCGGAGERLYATGDLARFLVDGNLEFLGRVDHQLKVRGWRLEPEEVEAALARHPAVRESAVAVRGGAPAGGRLVAFLAIAGGAPPPVAELRELLRRSLPEALIPSAFVALDALPRTAAGKVDRRALAALRAEETADGRAHVPPRTADEVLLVAIWRELLEVEAIGIEDDFFELGGHSLLATRLLSRIERDFGVPLTLRQVFERPTIAGQAELIAAQSGGQTTDERALARLLDELEAMPAAEVKARLARAGGEGGS
jgi:amino acid adenylation domain-containing protein